jgi:HEAT repeat protein
MLRSEPVGQGAERSLVERLRSGRTPDDRADAALALAEFDTPETVGALTLALADPAWSVRSAAGTALAGLRDPASTRALARIVAAWTRPELATARRAALRALTAFRSQEAAVELARELTVVQPGRSLDLEERSALMAVVYAEPSGLSASRVVRALVALLERRDGGAADRAASLLELFPAESCAPLARRLRKAARPAARRRAAEALRACRQDAAVAALVEALRDPAAEVRRAAASSLGDLRDPIAAGPLQDAARDPDEGVRRAAAKSVAALGMVASANSMAAGFGTIVGASEEE